MSEYSIKVVTPIQISGSMLVSTNIAEDDYPEYAAGTTYALGARVIVSSAHKIYESLAAGNVGNNPTTSPLKWVEVSATNRWKAFDTSNSSQTLNSLVLSVPTIEFKVAPGTAISSLSVLNIVGATSLSLKIQDPVYGLVYDEVIPFSSLPTEPLWSSWFFGNRIVKKNHTFFDLPNFPNAEVTIKLIGTTALAVGVIMMGKLTSFGIGTSYGAGIGIRDFSTKEKNQFGDDIIVKRPYAKKLKCVVTIDNSEIDDLLDFLSERTTTACLWIMTKDYEATTIYGYYKDFEILINYETTSDCNFQIEGFI